MAECNPCGSYLSIEDIINKSVKCSTDGKVSILGAVLNQTPDPPEGYEELKDSADETISDSVLSIIYVLEEA